MRCYIAGRMRGVRKKGFPAFDRAKAKLLSLGHEVVSPADMDRQDKRPLAQLEYAKRDVKAIFGVDAICLLKGWEKSVGASAEFFLSRWIGWKLIHENGTEYPLEQAFKDFITTHTGA